MTLNFFHLNLLTARLLRRRVNIKKKIILHFSEFWYATLYNEILYMIY